MYRGPPVAPTYWIVPRAVSRLYTGREAFGKRLARAFSYDHSEQQKRQRIFVITGLGGTGKSEICLKFAEDHQDEYITSNALLVSS